MSLNPGGANYGWNYSNPEKDGYSTSITGTVVSIQEVQKLGYTMNGQPGAPEFWPDGNPKFNHRIGLAMPDGTLKAFTYQPAGKEQRAGNKPSIHMDLFALTGNTDMNNLIGKTIMIWTEEPPAGFKYGQGNPRPWHVQLVDGGPYMLSTPLPAEFQLPQVLANNAASGGQVQQPQGVAPQNIQTPQVTQPAAQPAAQPVAQPTVTQPVAQPAATNLTVPLPTEQPAMPDGMDPAVAAAMQAIGASNVQPVQTSVYDEQIPF